jgi:hypothetical protein
MPGLENPARAARAANPGSEQRQRLTTIGRAAVVYKKQQLAITFRPWTQIVRIPPASSLGKVIINTKLEQKRS